MSCPKTLLKAVTAGRTRQVRLLLDLGASTEEQDDCGQTPLIRAALLEHDRNRDKILRTLLKRGAQVSRADVVGRNALMWACLYGRDNDVALMIEYADVDLDYNRVDINGQTALFHAVSSGNAATVKLVVSALMKYGLSTDTPDSRGTTPLMQAMRLGHDVCESILIFEGNAKVGLSGNSEFEKFNRREKWAVTSLRDRSKVKITKAKMNQSQFPPIEKQKTSGNDSPNIASRRFIGTHVKNYDSDENSLSSDEDSFDPLTGFSYRKRKKEHNNSETNNVNTPLLHCLQNFPPCKIPLSILASPAASSAGNLSSGDESEVDSVASTIIEGKVFKTPVRAPADLNSIYGMKQEQMTTSYRQTVVKAETTPEVTENALETETPTGNKNGRKEFEAKKWSTLKRSLRLTGLARMNPAKLADKPSDDDQLPKREGGLPNIFTEKKSQIFNKAKNESPKTAPKTPRMIVNENELIFYSQTTRWLPHIKGFYTPSEAEAATTELKEEIVCLAQLVNA
ncbi:uncharacterized protein LOC123562110 [Mercenaria mercenaria]|uniref:uncharacterized protein LOC123562110 n=1 Tax=Mercenaria mercenaria TaxID=6596 RepID=UPI001E1D9775|nr:uncharacterized protein LOC123562110 [Mercenaria mercenaria]